MASGERWWWWCVCVCVGGGGGGVLKYFHTYVGSGHFWGFKILNFNIILGFQKNEYFWGVMILWIFLGVITNLGYI